MTPLNVNKMCGTSRRVAKWRTKNCCQLARPTTWITLAAANELGQLPTRKRKTWNAIGIWEWGCGWGWQCCVGFASYLQMVFPLFLSLSLFGNWQLHSNIVGNMTDRLVKLLANWWIDKSRETCEKISRDGKGNPEKEMRRLMKSEWK